MRSHARESLPLADDEVVIGRALGRGLELRNKLAYLLRPPISVGRHAVAHVIEQLAPVGCFNLCARHTVQHAAQMQHTAHNAADILTKVS